MRSDSGLIRSLGNPVPHRLGTVEETIYPCLGERRRRAGASKSRFKSLLQATLAVRVKWLQQRLQPRHQCRQEFPNGPMNAKWYQQSIDYLSADTKPHREKIWEKEVLDLENQGKVNKL